MALRRKKDSVEFIEKLQQANAKLKAEKEKEGKRKAKEAYEKQIKAINDAKQKHMYKFLEKHVEFLEERDGFYRMLEDGRTYAAKPWYVYVDIEGEIIPEVYKQLRKGGWELGILEEDKLVIYPEFEPSIFQKFINWIRGIFRRNEGEFFDDEYDDEDEEGY